MHGPLNIKCDYGMGWRAEEPWFDFGQGQGVNHLLNGN
jgi:hypothetical protein